MQWRLTTYGCTVEMKSTSKNRSLCWDNEDRKKRYVTDWWQQIRRELLRVNSRKWNCRRRSHTISDLYSYQDRHALFRIIKFSRWLVATGACTLCISQCRWRPSLFTDRRRRRRIRRHWLRGIWSYGVTTNDADEADHDTASCIEITCQLEQSARPDEPPLTLFDAWHRPVPFNTVHNITNIFSNCGLSIRFKLKSTLISIWKNLKSGGEPFHQTKIEECLPYSTVHRILNYSIVYLVYNRQVLSFTDWIISKLFAICKASTPIIKHILTNFMTTLLLSSDWNLSFVLKNLLQLVRRLAGEEWEILMYVYCFSLSSYLFAYKQNPLPPYRCIFISKYQFTYNQSLTKQN